MTAFVLDPTRRWECTLCGQQDVTTALLAANAVRMHECGSIAGMLAPLTEVTGVELDHRAQTLRVIEREDYVGGELVRTDWNGRPVMAVETERADGSTDRLVFVPTARN